MTVRGVAAIASLAVLAIGCATPTPVRELATVTAGNVSIVNTRLRSFAQESEQVATERHAIIRELDDRVTAAEKTLKSKLEAMKLAGDTEKLRLFAQLDTILATLATLEQEAADRRAAMAKLIVESRSPLSPPINPLTATENTLADLGKKDEFKESLQFYGKFIGEVVKNVKDAQAAQERAKTATVSGAKSAAAAAKDSMGKDAEEQLKDAAEQVK